MSTKIKFVIEEEQGKPIKCDVWLKAVHKNYEQSGTTGNDEKYTKKFNPNDLTAIYKTHTFDADIIGTKFEHHTNGNEKEFTSSDITSYYFYVILEIVDEKEGCSIWPKPDTLNKIERIAFNYKNNKLNIILNIPVENSPESPLFPLTTNKFGKTEYSYGTNNLPPGVPSDD